MKVKCINCKNEFEDNEVEDICPVCSNTIFEEIEEEEDIIGDNECAFCYGSGEGANGRRCSICGGTGTHKRKGGEDD